MKFFSKYNFVNKIRNNYILKISLKVLDNLFKKFMSSYYIIAVEKNFNPMNFEHKQLVNIYNKQSKHKENY